MRRTALSIIGGSLIGLVLGVVLANVIIDSFAEAIPSVNGWKVNYQVGRYGENYLLRAVVAKMLLGANLPEDSVYFVTRTDAKGKQLNGQKNYSLTFPPNQLPPVKAFWSVTMYRKADLFFVPNEINRYAIGDRTQGLKREVDGSLKLIVGHNPPGDKSNWLPAPNEDFVLALRAFEPSDAILNQSWIPPVVKEELSR